MKYLSFFILLVMLGLSVHATNVRAETVSATAAITLSAEEAKLLSQTLNVLTLVLADMQMKLANPHAPLDEAAIAGTLGGITSRLGAITATLGTPSALAGEIASPPTIAAAPTTPSPTPLKTEGAAMAPQAAIPAPLLKIEEETAETPSMFSEIAAAPLGEDETEETQAASLEANINLRNVGITLIALGVILGGFLLWRKGGKEEEKSARTRAKEQKSAVRSTPKEMTISAPPDY